MESEDIMCETSYQLVNRVHAGMRPKLTNLLDFVKPNLSLESNEILEICGDSNCGKTYLLLQLISKAILPKKYGGPGSKVIYIDTQQTCVYDKIQEMLMKFVNDDVEALEEAQSNVIIFKVADPHQLHHKISMIIQLIKTTPEISLICFDAIGEYFWLSDDNYDESMEGFIRSNRNIFEDICQDFKISFIYVRAAFIPKNMGMQEVNYVISLTPSLEALKFEMLVEFSNRRIVHIYMIDLYGLTIC